MFRACVDLLRNGYKSGNCKINCLSPALGYFYSCEIATGARHFAYITKTSPCNEEPLTLHFYIVKGQFQHINVLSKRSLVTHGMQLSRFWFKYYFIHVSYIYTNTSMKKGLENKLQRSLYESSLLSRFK